MRYGSVCSGIEAASVAWESLGWQASFLSEIEPFPRSVLAHHYPNTPLHGDFTTIKDGDYEPIDLLVGGTPCQSFSVAGLRAGLDDPRGNLMLEFGALAKRLRPTWLVWENVPGVLSSNGGRDFGSFLAMLGQLGYGFAYRVLDAQYFGVAQRRRRVFVVGYLGDWRRAAAVLFESDCLRGNPAPSREAGKEAASDARSRVAKCLTAKSNMRLNGTDEDFVTYGIPGNWIGRKPENGGNAVEPMIDVAPCQTKTDRHGVAYSVALRGREGGATAELGDETAGCLRASSGGGDKPHVLTVHGTQDPCVSDRTAFALGRNNGGENAVMQQMAVRRLTPTECERLQGFPDNYTQVPHRNKPAADGPRYKALGNSMAVPVMKWIGERIAAVEAIKSEAA